MSRTDKVTHTRISSPYGWRATTPEGDIDAIDVEGGDAHRTSALDIWTRAFS
jgi:hypothetical protein